MQSLRRHLLHNDMLLVAQCFAGRDSKKLHLFTSMLSAHSLCIDERSFKGSQLENHEGSIKTFATTFLHAHITHMSFYCRLKERNANCSLTKIDLFFRQVSYLWFGLDTSVINISFTHECSIFLLVLIPDVLFPVMCEQTFHRTQ